MRIEAAFISLTLLSTIRANHRFGHPRYMPGPDLYLPPVGALTRCSEMGWDFYYDGFRGQTYCFKRDPGNQRLRSRYARDYAQAQEICLGYNAKLASPRGLDMHSSVKSSYNDGISRWVDVTYDYTLEMYVENGVPVDTSWLGWTPWKPGHPSNGRDGRNCTVATSWNPDVFWKPEYRQRLRSISCTNMQQYVCEFQICPVGWTYNPHVDRCNKFFDDLQSFENATKKCSQEEAIIETPRSRKAVQFLANLTSSTNPTKLWIGMMKLDESWRWNDGAVVTWTAWDRITNPKNANAATFKCMSTDVTMGGQGADWIRSFCNTLKAKYVCGKIKCRYPYQNYRISNTNRTFPTCYRFLNERVNARQAGQFCAEDGSKSNPSKLASPDNQNEYLMLNKVAGLYRIWIGYAWNRKLFKWQRNDNTFDDPQKELQMFNTGRKGHMIPRHWAERGRVCTIRESHKTYLTPVACDREYGFVCEREQPYVLTTCPERYSIQKAAKIAKWPNVPYYPRVPQSLRMNCYYYGTDGNELMYGEADIFCAGLGGYIMMPKTERQLNDATQTMTHVFGVTHGHWIGADSIAYCFNQNWCTRRENSYKYLDGSDGSPRFSNFRSRGDCVYTKKYGRAWIGSRSCKRDAGTICQVAHNNLKVQRNWDSLTACTPNYEEGVPNWYAAPGDKCFYTILDKNQTGQFNFINKCRGLSRYAYSPPSPAKPIGKDQTHSLVLSRITNNHSYWPPGPRHPDLFPKQISKTYIGFMPSSQDRRIPLLNTDPFPIVGRKRRRVEDDRDQETSPVTAKPSTLTDMYVWWPENGSYVPPKFINFGGNPQNPPARDACVVMKDDGRWQRVKCSDKHMLSCEKPSVPSLATWRSAHAARSKETSGADVPRCGGRGAWLMVTGSLLLWA